MTAISIARAAALALLAASSAAAQTPGSATAPRPANPDTVVAGHPDVLGAQRLFSTWLANQIANRGLPGVVVGVVADQSLVWARGFGLADVEAKRPMTPATKFRMASHSKLFTATAIMQLREEGKVRLDDPVSRHLPWFRVTPAGEDDGPITVEQLLTHASGLPREAGPHWTTQQFPTAAEVRALMAARQAPFAPATRWKYSNLAYTVAGMVVEQASGLPWAEYVQRHVFTPLGMTSSSVDRDVEGLATGYGRRRPDGSRERFGFVDARGMAAATGITSTVEDMARFVSAQFRKGPRGGDRILSTGSLREMHRVRSLENDWTTGNGIGFSVQRLGARVVVGHGGGYPGYTTHTLVSPEERVGVIVLTNAADAAPADIARQLMSTVGAAVAKAQAAKPATVAWDPSWARFAGVYRRRDDEQHVVLLNQRLVLVSSTAANLDTVMQLEPIGGGRFRVVLPTGGGPVGEIAHFVEANGRVVRLVVGDNFADRVP